MPPPQHAQSNDPEVQLASLRLTRNRLAAAVGTDENFEEQLKLEEDLKRKQYQANQKRLAEIDEQIEKLENDD